MRYSKLKEKHPKKLKVVLIFKFWFMVDLNDLQAYAGILSIETDNEWWNCYRTSVLCKSWSNWDFNLTKIGFLGNHWVMCNRRTIIQSKKE